MVRAMKICHGIGPVRDGAVVATADDAMLDVVEPRRGDDLSKQSLSFEPLESLRLDLTLKVGLVEGFEDDEVVEGPTISPRDDWTRRSLPYPTAAYSRLFRYNV